MLNILAFDPGSNCTGWCLLTDGRLVDTGLLTANQTDDFEVRRATIRIGLASLFLQKGCQGARKIDLVAVEDPQSKGFSNAKKLCIIKTMIEESAISIGTTYTQIHPSTWQALARKTMPELRLNKPKPLSLLGAQLRTGRELTQDEADAYWVGYCAYLKAIR